MNVTHLNDAEYHHPGTIPARQPSSKRSVHSEALAPEFTVLTGNP